MTLGWAKRYGVSDARLFLEGSEFKRLFERAKEMKTIFNQSYEYGDSQLNYFELAFCAEYLNAQTFVSKI